MGGKSSRVKGATFERSVAASFTAAGIEAKRGIGQARGGGAEVADVEVPFIHVECKAREAGSLYSALEQAERDATARGDNKAPCVVYKRNHKPVLVVMRLDVFAPMFARYVNNEAQSSAVGGSVGASSLESVSDDALLDEVHRRLNR